MGKILDFIVGNTFVFISIIGILVASLIAIIFSITKSLNKHKIPIYEEINENEEIEKAKDKDIIEKPKKKVKKEIIKDVVKDEPLAEDEVVDENENPTKKDIKEEVTEDHEDELVDNVEDEFDEDFEDELVENIENELVETDPEEEPESEEQLFDDELLREELEKIEDKEIEERIDKEHKKDIDEEIKDNDNAELKEILSEMKETKEVDPEEVVRSFEEEQEAQSIISYQELVNVVKNRENDFDDELESKPLATVSDFIKKDKKSDIEPEVDVLEMIEQLDSAKKPKEDVEKLPELSEELEDIETLEAFKPTKKEKKSVKEEKEVLAEIPEEGRFKKTDVISPVFGRIQEKNKIDYPKVEKFERKRKEETLKSAEKLDKELMMTVMPDFSTIDKKDNKEEKNNAKIEEELKSISTMFEDISTKVEKKEEKDRKAGKQVQEDDDIESLSAISKNEDFLKALRDFRDSL